MIERVRPAMERVWQRSLGRSPLAQELARMSSEVEDQLRSLVWEYTAPARRIEVIGSFLAWLANSTKRSQPPAPPVLTVRIPQLEATLLESRARRLQLPTSETPEVSVIIPAFNQIAFTYGCLKSIAAHRETTPYEIILVDDRSTDETQSVLATVDGLRIVRNAQQLGFIGGCNAGAAVARGRYLLFLNNDTEVLDGWLDELRRTFTEEPQAGLVGSKLIYPDGKLQEAGGIVFSNGGAWNVGRHGDPAAPQFNYLRRVDYCSGACLMVPTELFSSLGGFDTHFAPAYYEDTDLAFRVRAAGYETLYQPLSQIIHYEGMTSGTDVSSGIKQHQAVNEKKFAARWIDVVRSHGGYGETPELEQDRGVRGRVLFVDAVTPTPDRDSGSLRMFNLMQIYRRLGFKVTFVASNLAHIEPYTANLQRRGIEVLHYPYISSMHRYLRQEAGRYDVIVLSRAETAQELLELTRKASPWPRIIYDTVDLHYVREEREARLKADAGLMTKAHQRREQELRLARAADCTIVVSPTEQELLERALPGARIRVVSNIHDLPGVTMRFAERRDLMFLGGFGHPPNSDAVHYFVNEIMPSISQRLPDAKVFIVGSNPPDSICKLASEHVIITGFVPDLEPYLSRVKLTVAPLRYGAGVKGKINMSLSHGVPVVATSLAVEGMHLQAGHDVLVADDASAFADAVVKLYEDEPLWQELSRRGLEHTDRHFSFAAARTAIEAMMDELAPAHRARSSTDRR